ncbi:hypothetical protein SEUCBS140593_008460 [Sporothrix eucalyptigena]|uniref:F-box domain-containing protein n=1 Tax=Sporothrix eucalyptigena TaxID=1812306 RepID=A0ABP0CLP0_9PEZI
MEAPGPGRTDGRVEPADDNGDGLPKYCLTQRRCAVCQFSLFGDEPIYYIIGDRIVPTPPGEHRQEDDEHPPVSIHMCGMEACGLGLDGALGMHRDCYSTSAVGLGPPSVFLSPGFLAATKYSFPMSQKDELGRVNRFQTFLAKRLVQQAKQSANVWPLQLPVELWEMVAQHLTSECAAVSTRAWFNQEMEAFSATPLEDTFKINLDDPVYATLTVIEGKYYVQRLFNEDPSDAKTKLFMLDVESDGIKLRVIEKRTVPTSWDRLGLVRFPGEHVYWPEPLVFYPQGEERPPAFLRGTFTYIPRIPHRMRLLVINAPGTIGYSVACNGMRICSIVAHTKDEPVNTHTEAYTDDTLTDCCWIYHPLAPGETITSIHRRMDVDRSLGFPRWGYRDGLIFVSNYGRQREFGPFWGGEFLQTTLTNLVVHVENGEYCRLFFSRLDEHHTRMHMKLFAKADEITKEELVSAVEPYVAPTPPAALHAEMHRRIAPASNGPFHELSPPQGIYSSCSLQRVASIRLCINPTAPHRPVVGMLVSYMDSRSDACVGSWRFDLAATSEPMVVAGSSSDWLHIRFEKLDTSHISPGLQHRRSLYGGWYVTDIATRAPDVRTDALSTTRWRKLPWTGALEWWFKPHTHELYYNGINVRDMTD